MGKTQNRLPRMAHVVLLAALLALAGCATPKIEAGKFAAPKTVVIDDIPDINPVATIQVVTINWPAYYFSSQFDNFFLVGDAQPHPGFGAIGDKANQMALDRITMGPPVSVGTGAAMGLAAGVVGSIIQASAEETQKKAAVFPGLVRKATPGSDLRADLMNALRTQLEAKGIQVRFASETRNMAPRLRWLVNIDKREAIVSDVLARTAPVDADVLVQIVPIAVYAAPGPMNSYTRRVGIAVAMFNGRTREFIGWQAIPYSAPDNRFQYMRYDDLAADVDKAAPALSGALMSLVPQVVKVISGARS